MHITHSIISLNVKTLLILVSNVPSKLCACARAHSSWDERTQETWSVQKFSFKKICVCTYL